MAELTHDAASGEYIYRGTPAERFPAKAAGFRFDGARAVWTTRDASRAAQVAEHARDPEVRAMLQAAVDAANRTVEASRATTSEVEVPCPAGRSYLPFQRAGIAYALDVMAQGRGVLIGDEMGLGKTIQAIGILNSLADRFARTLVVCPASLRLNWAREIQAWAVAPLQVAIVTGGSSTDVDIVHRPDEPRGEVVIINYDLLRKHRASLRAGRPYDLLIVDEAHYLKSAKAQRTVEVLGKWDRDESKRVAPIPAERRIFLTGTPLPNRPAELYTLAKAMDHETFGNWRRYHTTYCAATQTRWGWDVSGASNLDELQDLLRRRVMVRRLKRDVLTELPAKRRQVIDIPANGLGPMVAKQRKAAEASEAKLAALRAARDAAEVDSVEYRAAVEALTEAAQVAFEEMSRERHELALAKLPKAAEYIVEASEDQPVVVMAHHLDVIERLQSALTEAGRRVVTLTGETSMADRQAAVDSFQAGEADVFIGNIQAAGVGITLTRSSLVIFFELDWVPGNISQAEDRCHRIGQHDSVLVQHLVIDGSLDATMARTLVEKQEVLDAALDADTQAHKLADAVAAPAERTEPGSQSDLDLTGLPAGMYAVPGGDTRLKVRVDVPTTGRGEGWVYVSDGAVYGQRQEYGRQAPGGLYYGLIHSQLAAILADPKAASAAYGKLTGHCGVCGAHLENEQSLDRGIGPVCASKFGG
jgi:SWI/SNF-related matrix-associated actin-dependent regulator of chromatin subfamily A-like protein 1